MGHMRRENRAATVGELESINWLERVIAFIFTGNSRKIPSRPWVPIGTPTSIRENSFPYIDLDVLNVIEGTLNPARWARGLDTLPYLTAMSAVA